MKKLEFVQNVVLIVLILGCIIYLTISRYLEEAREAFSLPGLGNFPDPPSIGEIGDKIKAPFEKIGNDMKGPFGQIGDIFAKIGKAFEDIPKRFNRIGSGFRGVFEGIGMEVEGTFKGVQRGFEDIGMLLNYSFELVRTYIFCGVKFLQNLHHCIFYYMFDAILSIMYLPVMFALWFLKYFTGRDLYGFEKKAWDFIYWVNDYIYGIAGFNIAKWPRSVRDLCYNCKRLKVSAVDNKANEVKKDFNERIANDLVAGKRRIGEGGGDFMRAFGDNP